jgi:hypothetical protein
MANPLLVTVTINEINRVATNIDDGILWALDKYDTIYLHTYRETGDAAPTDFSEFVPLRFGSYDYIDSGGITNIDVYVWPRSDTREGTVQMRIDIGD